MDNPFPPLPLPQGHFPQWGQPSPPPQFANQTLAPPPGAPAPFGAPNPAGSPAMPGLLAQLLGNNPNGPQDITSLLAALRAKQQQPAAPMSPDFGSANGAAGGGVGDGVGSVGASGVGGGGSAAAGVGGDDGGTY